MVFYKKIATIPITESFLLEVFKNSHCIS